MAKERAKITVETWTLGCPHCDSTDTRISKSHTSNGKTHHVITVSLKCEMCKGDFAAKISQSGSGVEAAMLMYGRTEAEKTAPPKKTAQAAKAPRTWKNRYATQHSGPNLRKDLQSDELRNLLEDLKKAVTPSKPQTLSENHRHQRRGSQKQLQSLRGHTNLSDPDLIRIGVATGRLSKKCETWIEEMEPLRWLSGPEAGGLFDISFAMKERLVDISSAIKERRNEIRQKALDGTAAEPKS